MTLHPRYIAQEHCRAALRLSRIEHPILHSQNGVRFPVVEQVAESALSGVGQAADATRRALEIAEAAIAEAKPMHSVVESEVASLTACADTRTAHAIEVLSGRVQEVVAHSDAQTSRVAEAVTWQLESEIQATATSTAAMAELNTCAVVEGMRQDV